MGVESDRLKKIRNIIEQGVNPYPSKAKRTHSCQDVDSDFNQIANKVFLRHDHLSQKCGLLLM